MKKKTRFNKEKYQVRVLQIRVLQVRVLQVRVLQVRVLQVRVLQIQSSPVQCAKYSMPPEVVNAIRLLYPGDIKDYTPVSRKVRNKGITSGIVAMQFDNVVRFSICRERIFMKCPLRSLCNVTMRPT